MVADGHVPDAGFYERLFHRSEFAIVVCSRSGTVESWNAAAARLFCGAGRLSDRGLAEFFPQPQQSDVEEHLAACAGAVQTVEFQSRLGGSDAEPIEYAVILTPVCDATGRVENVAAWFRDISPRVRLERTLARTERLTMLGRLSGAVAHHYSNLLCSIATSNEYAMNMSTLTAMRRALARASEPLARAASITRQLLAFAQADHSAADQSDLTETVLIFFDGQESRLGQRSIALELDYQHIPVTPVLREPLRVVLANLVDNAVEAMPDGGRLTVHLARRDDESVCITISDSGPGIPPQHVERVFEPFFTTKGELAQGAGHNPGLGLAVAHGLINGMHGTITASNIPGSGARFDVVLPLRPAD